MYEARSSGASQAELAALRRGSEVLESLTVDLALKPGEVEQLPLAPGVRRHIAGFLNDDAHDLIELEQAAYSQVAGRSAVEPGRQSVSKAW